MLRKILANTLALFLFSAPSYAAWNSVENFAFKKPVGHPCDVRFARRQLRPDLSRDMGRRLGHSPATGDGRLDLRHGPDRSDGGWLRQRQPSLRHLSTDDRHGHRRLLRRRRDGNDAVKTWLAIAVLLAGIAAAWAMPPSQQIIIFGHSASGGTPPTNFLLANTGSVLLVNTGVKFLIQ